MKPKQALLMISTASLVACGFSNQPDPGGDTIDAGVEMMYGASDSPAPGTSESNRGSNPSFSSDGANSPPDAGIESNDSNRGAGTAAPGSEMESEAGAAGLEGLGADDGQSGGALAPAVGGSDGEIQSGGENAAGGVFAGGEMAATPGGQLSQSFAGAPTAVGGATEESGGRAQGGSAQSDCPDADGDGECDDRDIRCNLDNQPVICAAAPPACPLEQHPVIEGGCYTGDCVDWSECAVRSRS